MKITEYKILDEANPDLLKYISSVDSQASSLGNKLGIKPKTPNDIEQSEYEYNITDISFILKSTSKPNMFRSRKSTFSYAFYDNMLHIYGSRSSRDQLKIYFDYNGIDLKEIKTGVEYKVDRVEGQFQNIIGRESFDTFILMTPDKILKSIRIKNSNPTEINKNNKFKPNANIDMDIIIDGEKTKFKGLVYFEAMNQKNSYKVYNDDFNFIFKTKEVLYNRPNSKYKVIYIDGKNGIFNFKNYNVEMILNKLKFITK